MSDKDQQVQNINKFAKLLLEVEQKRKHKEGQIILEKESSFGGSNELNSHRMSTHQNPMLSNQQTYRGSVLSSQTIQEELFQRLYLMQDQLCGGKKITLNESDLNEQQYYKKYIRYIVQTQSMVRGYTGRRRVVKLRKNYKYRFNVLNELVQTEISYVRDLEYMVKIIEPQVQGIFSDKLYRQLKEKLFGKVLETIYNLNLQMLNALQKLNSVDPQYPKTKRNKYIFEVEQVLKQYLPFFKFYFQYCKEQTRCQSFYKELMASDQKFKELITKIHKDPKLRGLGWDGFMVKPVQRLPKYELLLKDLLKHTEEDHPAKPLYEKTLQAFMDVLQLNDYKTNKSWMDNTMFSLQKNYGEPNGIIIPDSSRSYIKEENMLILDANVEIQVHTYYLTDLLLLCVSDADNNSKLHKYVYLNEFSSVQLVDDRRYQQNLTKVVGRNHTIVFVSESKVQSQALFEEFNAMLVVLRERRSNRPSTSTSLQQIEVSVKGTEKRDSGQFGSYTVYVIEVKTPDVLTKIFLRYQEIRNLDDYLQKEHPDVQLPHLTSSSWLRNMDTKVIEARKQEIEEFIFRVLTNEQLFTKGLVREKVLNDLQLPPELLEFEQQRVDRGQSMNVSSISQQVRGNFESQSISSHQSLKQSGLFKDSIINAQVAQDIAFVRLHDGSKRQFEVNDRTKALELCQMMCMSLGFKDAQEFKLFESDEALEKLRPLMDEETVLRVINSGSKLQKILKSQKSLIFRRYLFFPADLEDALVQKETQAIRIHLLAHQLIYDLRSGNIPYNIHYYYTYAALYLYITSTGGPQGIIEAMQRVTPYEILKKHRKESYVGPISLHYQNMSKDLLPYLGMVTDKTLELFQGNNKQMQACIVLNELVSNHCLYGVTLFPIELRGGENVAKLHEFLRRKDARASVPTSISLGVAYQGIHLIEKHSRRQVAFIAFPDLVGLVGHSDMVSLNLATIELKFFTDWAYQINSLASEYIYLRENFGKQD